MTGQHPSEPPVDFVERFAAAYQKAYPAALPVEVGQFRMAIEDALTEDPTLAGAQRDRLRAALERVLVGEDNPHCGIHAGYHALNDEPVCENCCAVDRAALTDDPEGET